MSPVKARSTPTRWALYLLCATLLVGADECIPDLDRDGVANGTDNCPHIANPDQLNSGGDEYGDECRRLSTIALGAYSTEINALAIQSDGKLVAVGTVRDVGGNWDDSEELFVARLDPETLELDSSFGAGQGYVRFAEYDRAYAATAVLIQDDGRILFAGRSHQVSNSIVENNAILVARLLPNGQLDPAFNGGEIIQEEISNYPDEAQSIVVQPDGKILVGGTAHGRFVVIRYDSSGDLDPSFRNHDPLSRPGVALLDAVTSTSGWGNPGERLAGMVLREDGGIVLGGKVYSGTSNDFGVAALESDGAIDQWFGTGWNDYVHRDMSFRDPGFMDPDELYYSRAVHVDFGSTDHTRFLLKSGDDVIVGGTSWFGGPLVVGEPSGESFALAKIGTDGWPEVNYFGNHGFVEEELTQWPSSEVAADATLQEDGKILMAGSTINLARSPITIARFSQDGVLDRSFADGGVLLFEPGRDENFDVFVHSPTAIASSTEGNVTTVFVGGSSTNLTTDTPRSMMVLRVRAKNF